MIRKLKSFCEWKRGIFLGVFGLFPHCVEFGFVFEAKNLMRIVNGLKESTCFCFHLLLKSGFGDFVLRSSKSMEGWLSWLKAPDSKSGARFIRAAGSNPAPSASFSIKRHANVRLKKNVIISPLQRRNRE